MYSSNSSDFDQRISLQYGRGLVAPSAQTVVQCILSVAAKWCYQLDLIKIELILANCRTFQPMFGTCNFKSIFRTVPWKLGQIVTLSGAEQPLPHVPSWCTETVLYVWIVFSECLSCL